MEFLLDLITIGLIVLLAAASPGPDFIVTVRNSVLHSRRAGMFTAIGIGLGNSVHIILCILGIAAVISQSVLLFNLIKYAGALYLIYFGFKCLRSKGYQGQKTVGEDETREDLPAFKAFKNGLFTNLLNPKAVMFFLALFTQVIDPHTPFKIQAIYGLTAVMIVTLWFTTVAITLNQRHVRRGFLAIAKWIDRTCGGLLIALGVKLALSKA